MLHVEPALDQFLAGQNSAALASGRAPRTAPRGPVFVFSGMGPQWWGMGRALMAEEPLVREVLGDCERVVRSPTAFLDRSARLGGVKSEAGKENAQLRNRPARFAG